MTDIKHAFSFNPLFPAYAADKADSAPRSIPPPLTWVDFGEEICEMGHPKTSFCFDNELPVHRVFLEPFQLASRLTTCGEYLEFIADGAL